MSLAALLRPVIAVACATALTGCLFSDPLESFGGPTMGSTYAVKYVRADGVADATTLQAGVEAILAEVDSQMSTYRDDSLIEQFNRAPAGTCMAMPSRMCWSWCAWARACRCRAMAPSI